MKLASPSMDREVSRIRMAYARRAETIPENRYSVFNQSHHLSQLELAEAIIRLLRRSGVCDLKQWRVLDMGCGTGTWLRQLIQWGARPENLFGVDLLPQRIREARSLCPNSLTLLCTDASRLAFHDESFDLILLFTVFTSVLEPAMRVNLANQAMRLIKPGGSILWYDFFVSNPRNPDVRGVKREEIAELFRGLRVVLERTTLAPPLGRAVGRFSPALYRLLSAPRVLRTHYLGLFQKAKDAPID